MPQFEVKVIDNRYISYYVTAKNAEKAQELVEASANADTEFEHDEITAEWFIEGVDKIDE